MSQQLGFEQQEEEGGGGLTKSQIYIKTPVYAAFGHWTLAVTSSFAAFSRSGREMQVLMLWHKKTYAQRADPPF